MTAGLVLPRPIPSSQQWVEVDRLSVRASSQPAASDGTAVIELNRLGTDERWLIDHAVIQSNSPTRANVRFYESVVSPQQLLDGSSAGTFDVADWPGGLLLAPATSLLVRWTNVAVGSVGTVALQVRVEQRRG